MSSQEAERILKFLENNDVNLAPSNTWFKSCIHWFRTHDDLADTYTSVEHYVLVQWLLADLEDVQNPCLPSVPSTGKTLLNGKYNVQINWMRDIAQSCYSQLQNVQNNNCESESNEFISADEPKKQSWEPNPKRVLMMEITDGVKTMKAMEYSPIPKLVEPFLPGLKVFLKGPIECRNGILFLTNNSITILGGEVEDIHASNSKEMILSKCLNITPNLNQIDAQDSGRNSVSTVGGYSRPNESTDSSIRSNSVSNNNRTRPPMIEQPSRQHTTAEQERDMFMDEEDDIFLQLPEEMFNNPADNNPSPVLNEISATNSWRQEETQQVHTFKAPLKLSNKPKLFPFLEEAREHNANSSPNNILTGGIDLTSNSSISGVPYTSSSSSSSSRETVQRLTNLKSTPSGSFRESFANKSSSSDSRQVANQSFVEEINGDSSDCVLVEEKLFPKFVMTKVKVENITNLKIRNKEWTCTANAIVDGNSTEITFSNTVLEKLFDVSASVVEVQREEMKNNEDLKKKVNARLKAGQNRIKALDCTMTLEYTSEDCVPSVVSIEL